jgi:tetratricopeptide (TPR) repeat protein
LAARLVQSWSETGHSIPTIASEPEPTSILFADWPETVRLLGDGQLPCENAPADDTPPDVREAARLITEAEGCQRRQQFAQAESLYSDAVLFDPTSASAWAGRGDTRVALGRPQDATRDYLHSLKLRPNHARTRFHLAVALSLLGDFQRAIDEFTQVIELRGDWGRAYLNRGIAYHAIGKAELAREDFATALVRDPNCEKARAYLETTDEVVEDVEVEEPAATATEFVRTIPKAVSPTAVNPSAHATPKPSLPKPGQFLINCPYCGEEGSVSWNRLNRAFLCKCGQRFGVNAEGQAVQLVVSRQGTLVDAGRHAHTRRHRRNRRLTIAATIALLLLLPGLALATRQALRPAPPVAEAPLPPDLDKRVELFTRSWLNNETRTMKRLTTPSLEREVYSWSLRQRPPVGLQSRGDGPRTETVQITQSSRFLKPTLAIIEVRISPESGNARSDSAVLVQTWEQRGEAWFFVPPSNARAGR